MKLVPDTFIPWLRRLTLLIAVSGVALAAGYLTARLQRPELPKLVDPRTNAWVDFALPGLDGREHPAREWRGKLLLVNFWATWCPPCREEIPLLIEVQRVYGPQGLQVIGITLDARDDVAPFARQHAINYPLLLGGDQTLPIMTRYGNRSGSLPFSVLISPEGAIIDRKVGAYRGPDLSEQLQGLLKR